MKAGKIVIIIAAFLIAIPAMTWSSTGDRKSDTSDAEKAWVMKGYGKLPLYFIENNGQIDEKVRFYEKGSGHSIFFTKNRVYLSLIKGAKKKKGEVISSKDSPEYRKAVRKNLLRELIELSFIDANKDPEVMAEGIQEGKLNYFIGNAPEKWKTNVSTYSVVRYKEVYDGIDIKFYGNNRQLEYDLIVSPGAEPAKARLAYSGIEGLRVTDEGELEIELKEGKIIQKRPYIYQEIEGERTIIEGSFRLKEDYSTGKENSFEYGFEVASYDKKYPLVIDPVLDLMYSTYLGGSSYEDRSGIAIDNAGNAYVAGTTYSTDFPTVSAYQGSNLGGSDVFVTKLNAAGTALIYSTYLGGSVNDYVYDIAIDSAGNAYVTGGTGSTDFPTASAYQGSLSGEDDVFVTKLNAAGTALIYSTYLGGSVYDESDGIAVDSSGNAYVTGNTASADFPTASAYQGSKSGEDDVFVTKLNAAGTALIYSTYLGGSGWDDSNGIAVDSSGNAYVTGMTGSTDFPTASAYQGSKSGGADVFITKLDAAGTALMYSTYFGGSGSDWGYGIAIDSAGNAYVTGKTASTDFPTASAYQGSNLGGSDVFVTKLNAAGTALIYSTYLGGSGNDYVYDIAIDSFGNAYVAGNTDSTDFPTASAYQGSNGGSSDSFITKLNAAGTALIYSTYLGGSGTEIGYSIAVESSGDAYVTGYTGSTDFPTVSAYQGSLGGSSDSFVTKLKDPDITAVNAGTGLIGGGTSGAVTLNVDFAGSGTAHTVARSDHDHDSSYVNISGDTMAGDLTVNGTVTATSLSGDGAGLTNVPTAAHNHSGTEIISGTVADAWIDAALARDNEIMPEVLANDGGGSTLDADLLDGQDSSLFMSASTDNWVNTTGDTMTGNLLVYGDVDIDQDLYVVGNIYAESDINSKQGIKPIESSLNKILSIEGVSFSWKDSKVSNSTTDRDIHYGVIAQQVESVIPEIVKNGENGNKKVAYMELIPVIIEVMKEQQQKDMLQSQIIKEQENIIFKLSERLTELEREIKLKSSLTSFTK